MLVGNRCLLRIGLFAQTMVVQKCYLGWSFFDYLLAFDHALKKVYQYRTLVAFFTEYFVEARNRTSAKTSLERVVTT